MTRSRRWPSTWSGWYPPTSRASLDLCTADCRAYLYTTYPAQLGDALQSAKEGSPDANAKAWDHAEQGDGGWWLPHSRGARNEQGPTSAPGDNRERGVELPQCC